MDQNQVTRSDLIQLLDRGTDIDNQVFDEFEGEMFAFSHKLIPIHGLRTIFELLIPKTTWTKTDYVMKRSGINIVGFITDEDDDIQLVIELDGLEQSFITTTDAIYQLFSPMKLSTYAFHLLETANFDLLLYNFDFWFKKFEPDESVFVRTVIENGKHIIRCFATEKYQPIDNHVLLYIMAWAMDKYDFNMSLSNHKIKHSKMTIDLLALEDRYIDEIGTISYGFSVINGENKSDMVKISPICKITNPDGSDTTMITSSSITISHKGSSFEPVIRNLHKLEELPSHVENVIRMIELVKNSKVDDSLAYRIIKDYEIIVGSRQLKNNRDKIVELQSNNTLTLLRFFGRLNEIPLENEDKKYEVQRLFWKVLEKEIDNRNK